MGHYSACTKKGSLRTAGGKVEAKPFKCSVDVDKQQRAFQITLTDRDTEKTYSISVYGDQVLELQQVLNEYVASLTAKA
jgi:hypothetical protein